MHILQNNFHRTFFIMLYSLWSPSGCWSSWALLYLQRNSLYATRVWVHGSVDTAHRFQRLQVVCLFLPTLPHCLSFPCGCNLFMTFTITFIVFIVRVCLLYNVLLNDCLLSTLKCSYKLVCKAYIATNVGMYPAPWSTMWCSGPSRAEKKRSSRVSITICPNFVFLLFWLSRFFGSVAQPNITRSFRNNSTTAGINTRHRCCFLVSCILIGEQS